MDYPKESTISRWIDESFSRIFGLGCRFVGIEFKYFGKNPFGTKMWLRHYRSKQTYTYCNTAYRFHKSDDIVTTMFDFSMKGYGIWDIRAKDVTWWSKEKQQQLVVEIYLHKTKRMNTNITSNVIDKLISNIC